MQVELLAICSATSRTKTLTLTSIFETVTASSLPATLAHAAVAAKIRLNASECGRKRFHVALRAPDATVTDLMLLYQRIEPPCCGRPTVSHVLIVPVKALVFEAPGQYTLTLAINGTHAADACIYVQTPQPKP